MTDSQRIQSEIAAIGSEGYVALQERRKFIGAELKHSYYRQASRNLEAAVASRNQGLLFHSDVS